MLEAKLNLNYPTSVATEPAVEEKKEETTMPGFMNTSVNLGSVETPSTTLN